MRLKHATGLTEKEFKQQRTQFTAQVNLQVSRLLESPEFGRVQSIQGRTVSVVVVYLSTSNEY